MALAKLRSNFLRKLLNFYEKTAHVGNCLLRCQFHLHFTNSFFANFLLPKITNTNLMYRKAALNTLVQKSCLYDVVEMITSRARAFGWN